MAVRVRCKNGETITVSRSWRAKTFEVHWKYQPLRVLSAAELQDWLTPRSWEKAKALPVVG